MSRKKIKIQVKDRVFLTSRNAREYAMLRYKEAAHLTGCIFKVKIWYWDRGKRTSAVIVLGYKEEQQNPGWAKDGN